MTTTDTGHSREGGQKLLYGGFVAWLTAGTISAVGDNLLIFALAWTASGLGAHVVTLVLMAGLLPPLLLGLLGGTLADRWGLRRTIIVCDIATGVILLAFLACSQLFGVTSALLVALALAEGTVNAFQRPANNALPRLFFPESLVPRAMGLTGSTMEIARITGPPLGAVLVVATSMDGVVLADLVSVAMILAVLLVVRPPYEVPPTASSGGSAWKDLREGLRAVRGVPGSVAMLGSTGMLAGSVIPMLGLCIPLLVRERGWQAHDAGLMETFWVVGAFGVSLLFARLDPFPRPVGALVAGPLVASAGIVLAVAASVPWLAFVGAGITGIGTALFTRHLFPLYLLRTPEGMLARFQSVLLTAQTVTMFLGNAWLGGLASAVGPAEAMLAASALCGCVGVPVLASPALRRARTR